MKIVVISMLTLLGFFNVNAGAFELGDSALFMERLDENGFLKGLNDSQIDELQNSIEQELVLSEQNTQMLSISSAFKSIKDLLSSAAGKVKAGFTSVADLTKRGFTKAADLAQKLGITDLIKEIPQVVAEAGGAAVEAFLQGLFEQKFGGV